MPPKRKSTEKKSRSGCACGDNCHESNSHLPGILLAAFGVLGLEANFGLIGMDALRAWPLMLVLIGLVLVAKVTICRTRS
ncbi:hypothetical protein H0O00_02070 [Candidatus Micrarchaeota archaeon]|nr:hypothetical protein [Candidatus Micrarchaeota archaeon]